MQTFKLASTTARAPMPTPIHMERFWDDHGPVTMCGIRPPKRDGQTMTDAWESETCRACLRSKPVDSAANPAIEPVMIKMDDNDQRDGTGNPNLATMIIRALNQPSAWRWTIQGFGMLRAYLTCDETVRLHIWSHADAVPGVSVIHDHPWDFTSEVLSGVIENERYYPVSEGPLGTYTADRVLRYWSRSLLCGQGGCLLGDPHLVRLHDRPLETYCAGQSYSQRAEEMHASHPSDGAVTVITRKFGADRDRARVCWPEADGPNGWVSAEPREATPEEIERIAALALAKWDGGR